jgi:hypothetical protein
MSHYFISSNPAIPHLSDRAVRNAAARRGLMVHFDPVLGTWAQIEPRLRLPIGGPLPSLAAVARLVYALPLPHKRRKPRNGRASTPPPVSTLTAVLDQLLARETAKVPSSAPVQPAIRIIDRNLEGDHHG